MRTHSLILKSLAFTSTFMALLLLLCFTRAEAQFFSLLRDYKILPVDEERPEADDWFKPRVGYLSFLFPNNVKVKTAPAFFVRKRTVRGVCGQWTQMYDLLSEDDRKTLQKEWIVNSGEGYYVLSPELVNDCDLRVNIGSFIYKGLTGQLTPGDRVFARKYSYDIVKVLRHIWDSPAFSVDGVHHEKYTLLDRETGLRQEAVAPFLAEMLKSQGLNSSRMYLLVTRPSPLLKPSLSELLQQAELNEDIPQQIYFVIGIQQISTDSALLYKLEKINRSGKISSKEVSELTRIINKFRSGRKVSYEDIDELINSGVELPEF